MSLLPLKFLHLQGERRMIIRTAISTVLAGILFLPLPVKAGEVFSMEAAVMRALEKNPDIENAHYSLQAAESSKKAARSSFGPSVSASYGYTRYSEERSGRERNATTAAVKLSQPLFTGFNLLNSLQKAELQEERQALQLESQKLAVAGDVQEAFISYLKAQESVKSAQRSLKRAKVQLDMASTAVRIGLRPRLDVLQAEVDVAQQEAQLIKHENDRAVWLTRLNTLLAMPADADADYQGSLSVYPFEGTLEACFQKAMDQRPDLLMARKAVEIALKDLGITRSAFWPQVSLNAAWNTSGSTLKAAGSRNSKTGYADAEGGVSISWTLFNSGKRWFLNEQGERQVKALEAAVRSSINNCAYTVRSNLLSAQDAYRSVQVSSRAVTRAKESYEDARMRYELQSGSWLDLLTAQEALSNAELSEISSRANCLLALSKLYKNMGELRPDLTGAH